jgi:GGDEF domain-containing protein
VNTLKRHGREIGKLLTFRETTNSHILLKKIEVQAFTDELTGICNRRQFLVRAEQFFSLSKRHSSQLSLVMIDIDRFKDVNDSYGHHAGAAVIIAVCRTIASRLRAGEPLPDSAETSSPSSS